MSTWGRQLVRLIGAMMENNDLHLTLGVFTTSRNQRDLLGPQHNPCRNCRPSPHTDFRGCTLQNDVREDTPQQAVYTASGLGGGARTGMQEDMWSGDLLDGHRMIILVFCVTVLRLDTTE